MEAVELRTERIDLRFGEQMVVIARNPDGRQGLIDLFFSDGLTGVRCTVRIETAVAVLIDLLRSVQGRRLSAGMMRALVAKDPMKFRKFVALRRKP